MPLPYAAAWAALTVATPLQAALATGRLALVNAVLAVFGFAAGFGSGGMLGLPAFVGCGALFGNLGLPAFVGCGALFGNSAARLHARVRPGADRGEWLTIHCRGGAAAGAGLMTVMVIGVVEAPYWPPPLPRYAVLGAVLSAGFAWHARASWREMRAEALQHAAALKERGQAWGETARPAP